MYPLRLINIRLLTLLIVLLCSISSRSQLVANFNIDKPGGCAPLALKITNTSTGTSSSAIYSWDLGNGNVSTLKDPAAIYNEEKSYTIKLTIKDGSNTASMSKEVVVYKRPTVDFDASVIKGCLPLEVNFKSNSVAGNGSISKYHWDFGDGSTNETVLTSSQHIYNDPKKATVSLTVTNSHGCHATSKKENIVEILPALISDFSAEKLFLCKEDEPVKFTNNSSGPGTLSFNWKFGNSASSAEKEPVYNFNKKGIYTVSLTVNSSEGCSATKTVSDYLNVADYKTDFTIPPLVCVNSNANFINNSQPQPTERTWMINDQVYYNYNSHLDYYFNTPGSHKLKLINRFGNCIDSAVKTVVVEKVPDAKGFQLVLKDSCGAPAVIEFKDTTAGAVKWEWDLNYEYYYTGIESTQQSGTYTYRADGYYRPLLKVFNDKGCSKDVQQYISISPPVASIHAHNADYYYKYADCDSLVYTFSATSTHEIGSYKWNFGDGSISTDVNPTHTFKKKGTFVVSLEFITKNGCKGLSHHYNTFKILERPKADFIALSGDTICGNNPAWFQAIVTGNYYDTYWLINNSYAANNNIDLSYFFRDTGSYKIQLVALNEGCRDTSTKKNLIHIVPSFPKISGYQHTCEGTRGEVTFTQASKYAKKWKWDFGDGETREFETDSATVKHTYKKTGHYKIVLTTTNGSCSNSDSIFVYVLVKQSPNLTSGVTEICKDGPWPFSITNLDQIPYLNYYYGYYNLAKWEYGDGTTFDGLNNFYGYFESTPFSGNLQYFPAGKDKIRAITLSYPFGCYDTTNFVPLKVKGVQADFIIDQNELCFNSPVKFNDVSTVSAGTTISGRSWNFGDGSTSASINKEVTHIYSTPGSYPIVLTITDNSGCTSTTSSYSKYITVNGPKASFTSSSTNVPIKSTVFFYNNTNYFNSYNTNYTWDFGDGARSNEYSPSHVFEKPGNYLVKLIAVDAVKNCHSESTQLISVTNFNAAFAMSSASITNSSCPPVIVNFTNKSQNAIKVKWDFGDGITAANIFNPTHIYDKPGRYIISLLVTGPNGLEEVYYDSLEIKMPATQMFSNKTEICKNDQVNFTLDHSQQYSTLFDFGDGNIQPVEEKSISHLYFTAGSYSPKLVITDAEGCSSFASLDGNIIVRNPPIVNITPKEPIICDGATVQLRAFGGLHYTWSPAEGLNNYLVDNPLASPVQTTEYSVMVTDDIGCMNTGNVKVSVIKPLNLITTDVAAICEGDQVQLQVKGADNYQWIGDASTLSNSFIPNPIAQPLITTNYTVTGTDKYGCFADTGSIRVIVNRKPLVNAGPDVELLPGNPVPLKAEGSIDIISWKWTPGNYLECDSCPATQSKTPVDKNYTITVKNVEGCMAADEVKVSILCDEKRISIPNAFTPNGDGKNDVFSIRGVSVIDRIIIFNRWGQKVYEREQFDPSDQSSCWNGTFMGHPVQTGNYIYYIEMRCPGGGKFSKRGNITVIN